MRIGAFELNEPLPALRDPHAFALLRPWIDVGGVGHLTVGMLESKFKARPLGRLTKPGAFYDFTRYRPEIRLIEGSRDVQLPNSVISHSVGPGDNDFIFFHLLEPTMLGEYFSDSVLKILQKLGVKRYCLLGGMYDAVPHTKQLLVTGFSSGIEEQVLRGMGIRSSNYEGPTTITILISQAAPRYGIEALTLIVHLPQYAQLDEDRSGELRLLEVFSSLYNFPLDLEEIKKQANEQKAALNLIVEKQPEMKEMIKRLEAYYDSRINEESPETHKLSPEVEQFLRDIGKRFGQSQDLS